MAEPAATVQDIHDTALALPGVTVEQSAGGPVYQVGRKSFVFFRGPRPDAVDPDTGARLSDVVVIWVGSESDKQALIQDPATPFFTTPHFDGHLSVLIRTSQLERVARDVLVEVIEEAWLARAGVRARRAWLESRD
jgi:hypothetical protein